MPGAFLMKEEIKRKQKNCRILKLWSFCENAVLPKNYGHIFLNFNFCHKAHLKIVTKAQSK